MREYHDGKNNGYLASLAVIKKSRCTFPSDLSLEQPESLSDNIVTSEDWTSIKFLPGSATWIEEQSSGEQGEGYAFTIECLVNKDRESETTKLKNLAPYELLALATDRNDGDVRLVGDDDKHCRLSFRQVKNSTNQYRIQITCTHMPHPAIYYTGAFTAS